jgi:type I restriction enzyme S subunit
VSVPVGWEERCISDVAELLDHLRVPVNSDERFQRGGDVPYYGANGLQGYIDKPLFNEPLILVAEDGGFFDEYETRPIAYRISGPSWVNNHAHVLRPLPGVDFSFLFYSLENKDIRWFIRGGTRSKLNQAELRSVKIFLPSDPNEQESVACILNAADKAVATTEALIAKLKAIKQGLLHDLLTRGLDAKGELRDPARHSEHFKGSQLGSIPRAWDTPTINELAVHVGSGITPTGGSNVYRTEGVLFIRSQNVTFEGLRLDDIAYIDKQTHQMMARSEVFAHDVLLNITGASIGRCCPVPEGMRPANVNQHVCAIRTANSRREDAVFLSAVLASFIGQHQIDRLNAGSNRQGLNYQQLRSFVVPWPRDDSERAGIATKIEAAQYQIIAEGSYLSKLKAIKKGLVQDLLTGRVRVRKELDIR